jgi:transposase IS116/IS110/IS902 family protein
MLAQQRALLTSHIKQIEQALVPRLVPTPHAQRLLYIPGIGKLVAFTVLLEIDDIARFRTVKGFWVAGPAEGVVAGAAGVTGATELAGAMPVGCAGNGVGTEIDIQRVLRDAITELAFRAERDAQSHGPKGTGLWPGHLAERLALSVTDHQCS